MSKKQRAAAVSPTIRHWRLRQGRSENFDRTLMADLAVDPRISIEEGRRTLERAVVHGVPTPKLDQ